MMTCTFDFIAAARRRRPALCFCNIMLQLAALRTCRQPPALRALVRRASTSPSLARYAVLIDANNVPARMTGSLMDEIQQRVEGVPIARRVYGDFSLLKNDAWKLAALEYGLETKMQVSPAKAKNATDIALSIDAMDLFYERDSPIDTFVIVTSDGDFAPLAQRLRRSGRTVVAVGGSPSFIASCDTHVFCDFAKTPPPNAHNSNDAEKLVDAVWELLKDYPNTTEYISESGEPGRWVHLTDLAEHVDAVHGGGWRHRKSRDFLNFRHMLESAPYVDSIEVISEARVGGRVGQGRAMARLRQHVWKLRFSLEKDAARQEIEMRRQEQEEAAKRPAAEAASPPPRTSWFASWFGGGSSQPAESPKLLDTPTVGDPCSTGPNAAAATPFDTFVSDAVRDAAEHSAKAAAKTHAAAAAEAPAGVLAKASAEPLKPPLEAVNSSPEQATEKEVGFVVECVKSLNESKAERLKQGESNAVLHPEEQPPPGDGWIHLNALANALDVECVRKGFGPRWRFKFVDAQRGKTLTLRSLLTNEPFASQLELEAVRLNSSHVDWYVRIDESS